jgi:hypothetical protein
MDLGRNDRMNKSINQPTDAMGVLCIEYCNIVREEVKYWGGDETATPFSPSHTCQSGDSTLPHFHSKYGVQHCQSDTADC